MAASQGALNALYWQAGIEAATPSHGCLCGCDLSEPLSLLCCRGSQTERYRSATEALRNVESGEAGLKCNGAGKRDLSAL